MGPQLIYVYIKDIGRCFENQEFCFTNDFNISYSPESGKIKILKNDNCFMHLWGNKISNINLIVGKNGSGKTTLLDLIATPGYDRQNSFPLNKNNKEQPEYYEWFAVYHIYDNVFVIEGYNIEIISDFKDLQTYGSFKNIISPVYSVAINYDFETQRINYSSVIQEYFSDQQENFPLDRKIVSLYMVNMNRISWYRSNRIRTDRGTKLGFEHLYLDIPLFANIYSFVSEDNKIIEKSFSAENVVCKVRWNSNSGLEPFTLKAEIVKSIGLNLYNENTQLVYSESNIELPGAFSRQRKLNFSIKEKFIIKSLEIYIIRLWIDALKKDDEFKSSIIEAAKRKIDELEFNEDSYSKRKEYLEKVVLLLYKIGTEDGAIPVDANVYDANTIIEFINSVELIEDKYFNDNETISVNIREGKKESIHNMLRIYDKYRMDGENNGIGFSNNVTVYFENISAGELEYINGFANLYTAINVAVHNLSFETILIVLDEPDASFHPEWSRRYIDSLCKFLDSFDTEREIKYQIVISTHSPFMISDVPKEHITCINLKNINGVQKRIARRADFGLMSNFYDIIKSDFFIESPIGERANLIFKDIVSSINQLETADSKKVNAVEKRILAIGEEIIRKKLIDLLSKKVSKLQGGEKLSRILKLREELRQLEGEGGDSTL